MLRGSVVEIPYEVPRTAERIIVLGVESTSHTFGTGLIEYVDGKVRILANVSKQYVPERGGIHPREASQHHSNVAHLVIEKALEDSGVDIKDISAIAVSAGPGLGPCLRVGATLARFLSSYFNKPLIAVNHALAHIEIGKLASGFKDPLVVYVSGGNTLLAVGRDKKYLVLGETLDISLGNLLDTFAREVGIAPPYVRGGNHAVDICAEWGGEFVYLPYTVKGGDLSFSGLLTAALQKAREAKTAGREALGSVCRSLRETAFNMLLEVTERNLVLTEKDSVLLVGGVASNTVLRRKMEELEKIYGVKYYGTPPEVSGDNGLMIAYTGLLLYLHGVSIEPSKLTISQRLRLDDAYAPWIKTDEKPIGSKYPMRGAEAIVTPVKIANWVLVAKQRVSKTYREEVFNRVFISQRTRIEAKVLSDLVSRDLNVPAPVLIDDHNGLLVMEYVSGVKLSHIINGLDTLTLKKVAERLGCQVARIHSAGIYHGDLTLANIIYSPTTSDITLIDFGLSGYSTEEEEYAIDIHLLDKSLRALAPQLAEEFFTTFLESYKACYKGNVEEVLRKLKEIRLRGRYISKELRRMVRKDSYA